MVTKKATSDETMRATMEPLVSPNLTHLGVNGWTTPCKDLDVVDKLSCTTAQCEKHILLIVSIELDLCIRYLLLSSEMNHVDFGWIFIALVLSFSLVLVGGAAVAVSVWWRWWLYENI